MFDLGDVQVVLVAHSAEIGFSSYESYSHPHGFERVIEAAFVIHLEARDLDIALSLMETPRPLSTLLKTQFLQEVVDGRTIVGQEEVETGGFGAVEQSDGLKLIAAVILIFARLGHHRDLFLRA